MPATDDSFFSRWSRRKVAVRQGEVPPPEPPPEPSPAPPAAPTATVPTPRHQATAAAPAIEPTPVAEPPAPTLADVQQLTPASDFTAFVRPEVQPEVRNAALKKLFADPHFNVMDGLDTYIDDYNTPDPLPPGMLRQLVQSEMLGLFAPAPAPQSVADTATETPPTPAPSSESKNDPTAPAETAAATPPTEATPPVDRHEDADLQLQPDDAAGRPGADPGAAAHAGGPH